MNLPCPFIVTLDENAILICFLTIISFAYSFMMSKHVIVFALYGLLSADAIIHSSFHYEQTSLCCVDLSIYRKRIFNPAILLPQGTIGYPRILHDTRIIDFFKSSIVYLIFIIQK